MSFILSLFLLCVGASAVAADFQCTQIPGKLKQIDAGAGEVYGVMDDGNIFHWVSDQWQQVSGKLIHVSVGAAGVWGVNAAYNTFKLQDSKWKVISGLLKQVDAGGNKFLGGVNADSKVFCLKQSCTISNSALVVFTPLDGNLKYYSCGPFGCWGVNAAENIFFRQSVTPEACEGSQWQQVEGNLMMLEVGADGSVYGVNSAGRAFRREGISAKTPTGSSWTPLDFCANFKHLTYDNGFLWLLAQNGDIYRCADGN